MIQHEEELYRTLDSYGIKHDDVCIVGSSILARAGFRDNNDVDIILRPSAREILVKRFGNAELINLSDNIQVCTGRYSIIGIDDAHLFSDEYCEDYESTKIAKFELETAKKLRRLEDKDQKDLVDIGRASGDSNFDWGKIFYLAYLNGEPIRLQSADDKKVSFFRKATRRVKRLIISVIRG